MIACKPQKFPVSLWIVTLTEPGDTKPKKQNWDRLKMFKEMNGLRIRNRPEIRLNPVPAGFPASKSGSGSGPVSKLFAGF